MSTPQTNSLGAMFRKLRLRRAMTLRELSDASGMSEQALSAYEAGINNKPRPDSLKAIADALRATLAFGAEELDEFCRVTGISPSLFKADLSLSRAVLHRVTADTISGHDAVGLDHARQAFARLLQAAGPAYVAATLNNAYQLIISDLRGSPRLSDAATSPSTAATKAKLRARKGS